MLFSTRWNTLRVIFGTVEIYVYIAFTVCYAILSLYKGKPVWISSYYDPDYDATVPQVSSVFTGFFFTLLAIMLSPLQGRSQQFSLTIKGMLKNLATECLTLVKKMNDHSITDYRDDVIAYPEVFRKALLKANRVQVKNSYLPEYTPKGSVISVIESLHDKLRGLQSNYNHKRDGLVSIIECAYTIHHSSYAIYHTEHEYLYSVTSDMISISAYGVILSSPYVFWSAFGRYLGTLGSFAVAFVIIGLMQGARNRNVYEEISDVCPYIPHTTDLSEQNQGTLPIVRPAIGSKSLSMDYVADWCREWSELMYNLMKQSTSTTSTGL